MSDNTHIRPDKVSCCKTPDNEQMVCNAKEAPLFLLSQISKTPPDSDVTCRDVTVTLMLVNKFRIPWNPCFSAR